MMFPCHTLPVPVILLTVTSCISPDFYRDCPSSVTHEPAGGSDSGRWNDATAKTKPREHTTIASRRNTTRHV
ncbi:hypothetical protein GE09DRAFT_1157300 [Coniochaeta sp. 2T2.1]|nr:hypothetical protein GE09DRAFT_1157300 [Coniochaeta sp. 2T2.1]